MSKKRKRTQSERSKILNMHIKSSPIRQKELAEMLGVSEATISYWCSGRVWPSSKNLKKLGDILGLTEEELSGDSPVPFPEDYEKFREQARLLDISYANLLELAKEKKNGKRKTS